MATIVSESKRLEAARMVSWTPSLVVPSRFLCWLLSFAVIFAGSASLILAADALWPPLGYVALAAPASFLILWWKSLADWVAAVRAGLPMARLRARMATPSGPDRAGAGLISGVEPGAWVSLKEPVDFRLCTAKYQINGTETRVAFSDGTVQAWHTDAHVLNRPFHRVELRQLRYDTSEQSRAAAEALLKMARALRRSDEALLETMVKGELRDYPVPVVLHALRAGVLWGLVAAVRGDAERLDVLISSPRFPAREALAGPALRLTEAGHVWLRGTRQ